MEGKERTRERKRRGREVVREERQRRKREIGEKGR